MRQPDERSDGEEGSEAGSDGGDAAPILEAYVQDQFFGVVPEPRPARWYRENGHRNMTTGSRQRTEAMKLAEAFDSFGSFDECGWIFAFPSGLGVKLRREDEGAVPRLSSPHRDAFSSYRYAGRRFRPHQPDKPFVTVDTMWVTDLPDGYSLLLVPLTSLDDERFEVVPRMIDADVHPGTVNVPIRLARPPTEIEIGTQLARVIPIHRERCALDGRIEPSQSTDAEVSGSRGEGPHPGKLVFRSDEMVSGGPPAPEPAHSYLNRLRDAPTDTPWDESLALTGVDTQARDAIELGWFVKMPVELRISASDGRVDVSYSPRTGPESSPDALHSFPSVNDSTGKRYVRLDTGWVVSVPEGYDLLFVGLFAADPRAFTVIGELRTPGSGRGERSVRLDPLVRIDEEEFEIERGQPVVRILPVRRGTLDGTVRPGVMTDRHEFDRYERGMELYDYYADQVRRTHPKSTTVDDEP